MGERFSPGFRDLLKTFELPVIEAHAGTVFGLWRDLRLAYFNPWWLKFAEENDGEPSISLDWGLGRSLLDSVPDILRPFYRDLYGNALQQGRLPPLQHEYECSSADLFRRFMMTVYPLRQGEGFLVVNSLAVEKAHDPHERKDNEPDPGTYIGDDGLIRQCSNCRRTKNAKEPNRWDWVSAWVAEPPARTSHTLCAFCLAHYYPGP